MKVRGDKYKKNNRMAGLNASISSITLNVIGINILIKRQNGRGHFKNTEFNCLAFIRNSRKIQ